MKKITDDLAGHLNRAGDVAMEMPATYEVAQMILKINEAKLWLSVIMKRLGCDIEFRRQEEISKSEEVDSDSERPGYGARCFTKDLGPADRN